MTLLQNIHRAVTATCLSDILGRHLATKNPKIGSRIVYGRLDRLRRTITRGTSFNASTLAAKEGCCAKTIHRDIDFLRSQGVNLTYDHTTKTFRSTH